MGRIIAIANQKGGVGKTTTAINLSAALAEKGKRVLAIDMDPQGNMTSGFGIDSRKIEYSLYDALIGECNLGECMLLNVFENLSVLPSSMELAGAEIDFLEIEEKQYVLKKLIKNIKKRFDYVIIDCPPALSILTLNALTAADTVIVPIQCEFLAMVGLTQLLDTINKIKKGLNKKLEIEGVVFTMYDSRTNISLEVVESVKESLDSYIYNTIVPRNVRLSEAPSYGLPVTFYDKKSAGANAYRDLADEVINNKLYE